MTTELTNEEIVERSRKERERREQLEQIVNLFASDVLKNSRLAERIKPGMFRFMLTHDSLANAVAYFGDPVKIVIQELQLVEALAYKGRRLSEFRDFIDSCLRMVPLMHPSTAVTIPAKIITKKEDEKWKKYPEESDELLFPNLIPDHQINYNVKLFLTATDVKSGRIIRLLSRSLDLERLKRDAREILSEPEL